MNRQRKVLVTVTYNELGVIVDTKTEELDSSLQPEQSDTSEFWRKRADYYRDMCLNLVGEMGKGVKIASVKISENGIEFIKEQPSAQPVVRTEMSSANDTISRQSTIDALDALCDRECEYSKKQRSVMCGACRLGSAFDVIDELPSAQPEIIRCKDCKNSEHWYRDRRRCFLWSEDGVSVFDDGFCNYAERRQDE